MMIDRVLRWLRQHCCRHDEQVYDYDRHRLALRCLGCGRVTAGLELPSTRPRLRYAGRSSPPTS